MGRNGVQNGRNYTVRKNDGYNDQYDGVEATFIMKIMIGIIDMMKGDMVTMTIIGMIHRMIE